MGRPREVVAVSADTRLDDYQESVEDILASLTGRYKTARRVHDYH